MSTYVTTSEAARILGVSRQAVLKRVAAGTIRARRDGRAYRIELASLAAPSNDPVLAEMVERLVAVYHPARVYLFGSKARGTAGPDSDYDLLVVVADDASPELMRGRVGYAALSGLATGVDIVVQPLRYFEARVHLRASLPGTVLREGKLLYAA
ncbi:MAG: nucleotidyltransferase domain-containing protein [Coriobacteriales bacterium]|nr:nucleotidyltransferase domain-containing protein [Coriobacteriales bacterium]